MSDSQTKVTELAPRPQLPTPAVKAVAKPVNATAVQGVEEMQEVHAAAEPSVNKPVVRHPITRIEKPDTAELPAAKPAMRHAVRRPKLEAAVAEQREKELAATLVGLQDVTVVCRHKEPYGVFCEVTEGKAKGVSGLLHVNNMPGGKPALEALTLGDILTLDITDAQVQIKRNMPIVKLAFDGSGQKRRAEQLRTDVFARGDVPHDGGSHWIKARRGKERFEGYFEGL